MSMELNKRIENYYTDSIGMVFDNKGFGKQSGYVIYDREQKLYQGVIKGSWVEHVIDAKFYMSNPEASKVCELLRIKHGRKKIGVKGIRRMIQFN